MKVAIIIGSVAAVFLAAGHTDVAPAVAAAQAPPASPGGRLHVPVDYYKLPNGLKVVLSRDTTTPTACVAVYYNIGFRNEPKDRTGFAHLFEHMMFQGSQQSREDGVHQARRVQRRAAQRLDALRLHQLLRGRAVARRSRPSSGPRPTGCAASRSTRGEPEESAGSRQERGEGQRAEPALRRLPVDRPADGRRTRTGSTRTTSTATWRISTPPRSRTCSTFFKTYYAPNNAALVVTGDFDPAQTLAWIQKYFGDDPVGEAAAAARLSRSRDRRRRSGSDATIRWRTVRRSAIGYHMPDRGTPEWYAFGLIDQILAQGGDSRLYQTSSSSKKGLTGGVSARHQLRPRQHVRLQRPDALDRAALPRRRQDRPTLCSRRSTRIVAKLQKTGSTRPTTRPRAREDALDPLCEPRTVRRVRPRQPARLVRALRRRSARINQLEDGVRRRSRRRCCRRPPTNICARQSDGLRDHAGQDRRAQGEKEAR